MRRRLIWIPIGLVAAAALALWGVWTWRINMANRDLALSLEAERQRSFNDLVEHVEQIQGLLGKGLAAGSTLQNMRYMSDAYYHAQGAVRSFTSLPLPAELSATTGKFLQQTGDFAQTVLRGEAAGRELTSPARTELDRLRGESRQLSGQLNQIATRYNQGSFQWNPPMQLSWKSLTGKAALRPAGKQDSGNQSPASMVPGGWEQVGTAMGQLPVLLYDGPFSDHVGNRAPAMTGDPVSRDQAQARMRAYLPQPDRYTVSEVVEAGGNLPAYSFRLTPAGSTQGYTMTAEITRSGGYLLELINSRIIGLPKLSLDQARDIGQHYLTSAGYPQMYPTYGQVQDGAATIAYAWRENGVIAYPDQIKVKVALDTGEVLSVDATQYLMNHHQRRLGPARISPEEARTALNPDLDVHRVQLALIPDMAGTGETLTYEFLTSLGNDTFLVYVNASTGHEEQILQQIQTDNGTFAL